MSSTPRKRKFDAISLAKDSFCFHGTKIETIIGHINNTVCSVFKSQSECRNDEILHNLIKNNKTILSNIHGVNDGKPFYCFDCCILSYDCEIHLNHTKRENLTSNQLRMPSLILNQISKDKTLAQYHFDLPTINQILYFIEMNKFTTVIFVGSPRLFEHQNLYSTMRSKKITAVLLDADTRLTNFYSNQEFYLFNMVNGQFYSDQIDRQRFIDRFKSEKILIFCDPPFSTQIDLVVSHLDKLSTDLSSANETKIIFVMPYYFEKRIAKTDPSLLMSDYRVTYENHPKFKSDGTGSTGKRYESVVRFFTNIELENLRPIPGEDTIYKYCNACEKYVHPNNVHCIRCGKCPTRHGKTYKHCKFCNKCHQEKYENCKRTKHDVE